jgi:hypothetical protein
MIAGPEAAGHLKEVSLEVLQDHITTAYEEMSRYRSVLLLHRLALLESPELLVCVDAEVGFEWALIPEETRKAIYQGIVAATKADVEKMQEGYAVAAEFVTEFNVAEKATATFPLEGKTLTVHVAKHRLKKKIIKFIDNGQDMLYMEIRQDGIVLTAGPFHAHIWREYFCLNYAELADVTDTVKLIIVTDEKVEERSISLSIRELEEVECDLDELKAEHPAYPPTRLYKVEVNGRQEDTYDVIDVREDGTVLRLNGEEVENVWSVYVPSDMTFLREVYFTSDIAQAFSYNALDNIPEGQISAPRGFKHVNGLLAREITQTWCNLTEATYPPTVKALPK